MWERSFYFMVATEGFYVSITGLPMNYSFSSVEVLLCNLSGIRQLIWADGNGMGIFTEVRLQDLFQ